MAILSHLGSVMKDQAFDVMIESLKREAHKYASALGNIPPEGAYVQRFNGYFSGYMSRVAGEMSEESKAKYLLKEEARGTSKLKGLEVEGVVYDEYEDLLGVVDGEDLL